MLDGLLVLPGCGRSLSPDVGRTGSETIRSGSTVPNPTGQGLTRRAGRRPPVRPTAPAETSPVPPDSPDGRRRGSERGPPREGNDGRSGRDAAGRRVAERQPTRTRDDGLPGRQHHQRRRVAERGPRPGLVEVKQRNAPPDGPENGSGGHTYLPGPSGERRRRPVRRLLRGTRALRGGQQAWYFHESKTCSLSTISNVLHLPSG